jgi:hypothetical protein
MMLASLEYKVTIVGVINPHSVKELSYSVDLQFAGKASAAFSTMYAIEESFPLSVTSFTSTNMTIGQANSMTIVLKDDYYQFDSVKILIPKSHFTQFNSLQGQASVDINENSTFFTLSGIYQLDSHSLILEVTNFDEITAQVSEIVIQMFVQGFLSS